MIEPVRGDIGKTQAGQNPPYGLHFLQDTAPELEAQLGHINDGHRAQQEKDMSASRQDGFKGDEVKKAGGDEHQEKELDTQAVPFF